MDSSQFMIRLGEHNITAKTPDDAEEDYLVSKVIPHPEFNPKSLKNDIAIMRLEKKVSKLTIRLYYVTQTTLS